MDRRYYPAGFGNEFHLGGLLEIPKRWRVGPWANAEGALPAVTPFKLSVAVTFFTKSADFLKSR